MAGSTAQPAPLFKLFRYVDANRDAYIQSLRQAVAFRSVSCRPDCWPDIVRLLQWAAERFRRLGATTEMCVPGAHSLKDSQGRPLQLPPVLLAALGSAPGRKRVLVYLHVDVALGWEHGDFQLVEAPDGEMLVGRGASDCKAPLICWLQTLDAYHKTGAELPVNLKFIVHGVHEIGSPGLEDFLRTRKNTFLRDVDLICVTDSTWLRENAPCVVYGTRGLVYFHLEVAGLSRNLHSGEYGGVVQEPLTDLVYLLNALQDKEGNPRVQGLQEDVLPLTPGEEELTTGVDFDINEYKNAIGAKKLKHESHKCQLLLHRWRYPSLSFHGIEGALSGPDIHTSIPRRVVGKFSLRLVPNQAPEKVSALVERHLEAAWAARNSPNQMRVETTASIRPWLTDPWSPHFCAARRAVKRVYKVEADMVRDGCSMEGVIQLHKICNKSIVMLPICSACGGGPHGDDECIRTKDFMGGIKLMAAYMYEVGQIGQ